MPNDWFIYWQIVVILVAIFATNFVSFVVHGNARNVSASLLRCVVTVDVMFLQGQLCGGLFS